MTTLWKIISDQSSEYIMSIEDPEGWRSAEVKWDGCVHYYLYSNTPKGVNKANDDESEYIHICSIDEEIARLQALKRMAYNYFETSRGGDHYWHPDIVDGSAVTACAISSDEADMLQIAEAKQNIMTIPHGLPPDYTLEVADNEIYVKNNGRYVVTKRTGQRIYIKGLDEKAFQSARTFAWSYYDGNEREYELEVVG